MSGMVLSSFDVGRVPNAATFAKPATIVMKTSKETIIGHMREESKAG